jgi:hypothetical protein
MTPDEMVGEALAAAADGLAAGEHPIGAVVVLGDEVVGRADPSEKTLDRRWCATAPPGRMPDWAHTLIGAAGNAS